jgi:hypothetical protein
MFHKAAQMIGRRRFLDVLSSLYIYNEYRGYSSIDRVLDAVYRRCPDEAAFIAQVQKHRADERKHYVMFKRYFELRGEMPFVVDRTCGHIDRLIGLTFGTTIDDLDTDAIVADESLFNKLCRVIVLTEQRGQRTLEILLRSPAVLSDPLLVKIFQVIRKDEPDHWQPYHAWLERHGDSKPKWTERVADWLVHRSLVSVKLPILFMSPWLARRTDWLDAVSAITV